MCTYINFFPHVAILRRQQVSNFVWIIQKPLGINNFVRIKGPTGSKFSKFFFQQLYTGWTVVHLYCGFSLWRQMAPLQSAKFRTAFLVNFVPVWGRIASPIRLCIDLDAVFICYGTKRTLQRTKHFADPSVGGATRFAKLRSTFCKA